jgi:hypothetical protein
MNHAETGNWNSLKRWNYLGVHWSLGIGHVSICLVFIFLITAFLFLLLRVKHTGLHSSCLPNHQITDHCQQRLTRVQRALPAWEVFISPSDSVYISFLLPVLRGYVAFDIDVNISHCKSSNTTSIFCPKNRVRGMDRMVKPLTTKNVEIAPIPHFRQWNH